jgi:hypothetical protein
MLGKEFNNVFASIVILKNNAVTKTDNIINTNTVETNAAIPFENFNFLLRKLVNGLVIIAIKMANTNGPVYERVEKNNANNAVKTIIKIIKFFALLMNCSLNIKKYSFQVVYSIIHLFMYFILIHYIINKLYNPHKHEKRSCTINSFSYNL